MERQLLEVHGFPARSSPVKLKIATTASVKRSSIGQGTKIRCPMALGHIFLDLNHQRHLLVAENSRRRNRSTFRKEASSTRPCRQVRRLSARSQSFIHERVLIRVATKRVRPP